MEKFYYRHHQPPKGGSPSALNAVPDLAHPKASAGPSTTAKSMIGLPPPKSIPLVVHPGLPNEGAWKPTGPLIDGRAAMNVAQFRADKIYTSQLTTAVWLDPARLRLTLIPGLLEPGGTWSHPPHITTAELPKALAAFNGGFRLQDSHGGFYLDGNMKAPLTDRGGLIGDL